MGKITSYAALSSPASADLLIAVDVSDTSMAATGTDKQLTLADLRTWLVGVPAAPAVCQPAAPAATASTTLVMMGLGATCTYTPASSGKVLVNVTGSVYINTTVVNVSLAVYYGTGTAPANGAAATGTVLGNSSSKVHPGTGAPAGVPVAFTDVLSLTAGTVYWFDFAIATNNAADTAGVQNVSMTFVETS